MSITHEYRADGFCKRAECFRHRSQGPDFGLCPDTAPSHDTPPLPPDKADALEARRREKAKDLGSQIGALAFDWFTGKKDRPGKKP